MVSVRGGGGVQGDTSGPDSLTDNECKRSFFVGRELLAVTITRNGWAVVSVSGGGPLVKPASAQVMMKEIDAMSSTVRCQLLQQPGRRRACDAKKRPISCFVARFCCSSEWCNWILPSSERTSEHILIHEWQQEVVEKRREEKGRSLGNRSTSSVRLPFITVDPWRISLAIANQI